MTGEYWYEDETGNIVYVPVSEIQGEKTMQDGSTRFKFIGGPLHDKTLRVYPPYETVKFPTGDEYNIHPPLNLKRSKKWVYIHNPETGHHG